VVEHEPPSVRWKQRAVTYGPLVVAVAILAWRTIDAVRSRVGHAAATLDDSYIHFQYARAIAEGHPLRFESGEPPSSGATSMLWPAILAPFWALGAKGDAILWPAWAISFAALGALAWEARELTRKLAGKAAAVGAAAMVLAFGGLLWCAASGMEVVPFAWAIARASRRASDWQEDDRSTRTWRRAAELVALVWAAALLRPEGAITALLVAAVLVGYPRTGAWRERAIGLAAAAAPLAIPLLLWALTGSARSNTAVAKLLPGNPYYAGPTLIAAVSENAQRLVRMLLNGEVWSAEFVPHGWLLEVPHLGRAPLGSLVATAGLGAVAVCGWRTGARWRAAAVVCIALTMFAPCFYYTFLWNRLRYLWPFAPGWIIGLACLARVLGDLAGELSARWRVLTPIACGVFVGLFASKLEWVIEDVAQSASGIQRQQVALGKWARANLPEDARIGVNDTGAIAYFGERPTFDVVGLTTAGEARYWVAGVGSRFEHYERLERSDRAKLPTHFIVYPEWLGLPMVLGDVLHEATVTDATILGGQTMRAYVADWSSLGTGEDPWTRDMGRVIDVLDVADLDSEADHGYELLGAREGEQTVHDGTAPDGSDVVDGGRTRRTVERFVAHLQSGSAARCVVRLAGHEGTRVRVLAGGEPVGAFDASSDEDDWVERAFNVPAAAAAERTPIELRTAGGDVETFHYWCASRNEPTAG
jgi:hypothetical protein